MRLDYHSAAAKGGLGAYKWQILRRTSQASILALFLAGPLAGLWIIKGNLASSLILEKVPLTDPFVLLQSLAAGHDIHRTALIGAAIVLVFYAVFGRAFCAWVCPVNIVTDAADWLRLRLGIRGGANLSRRNRYWMLAMVVAVSLATGTIAWELVNPVSALYRGILFGFGLGWVIVAAVFLFDLLVNRHGWCGHLCPMGAFYGLVGSVSLVRVAAIRRQQCDDCRLCYAVCPEPQVIQPALKGSGRPVVLSPSCTNCGRCIDVCPTDVFAFASRFHAGAESTGAVELGKERA
jgi:ferredoxin-type protein NapH